MQGFTYKGSNTTYPGGFFSKEIKGLQFRQPAIYGITKILILAEIVHKKMGSFLNITVWVLPKLRIFSTNVQ